MNTQADRARRISQLFGTTSLLTLAGAAADAQPVAQVETAQAAQAQLPEQVLVTGIFIRGTTAVGAPVTELGAQDFAATGTITIAQLLTTEPEISTYTSDAAASSGYSYAVNAINIHGLQGNAQYTTTLTLIDGLRMPLSGTGALWYDPSIIPSVTLDRIDVLADGASATYGSDAVSGVVNVILRRRYDGAILQTGVGQDYGGGGFKWDVQALYGRTWNGGDVTVGFENNLQEPMKAKDRAYYTEDFTPWGLNNDTPVVSAIVPIISTGAPNSKFGTSCSNCYSVPANSSGIGLTWTQLLANAGTGNEINPTTEQWILPAHQYDQGTITFDQDLWPGVQFNASAYYANRRTQLRQPDTTLQTAVIPTTNPYYPAGAPAGLVANLSFPEVAFIGTTAEVSDRYTAGFTFALPGDWEAKLFGATGEETEDRRIPTSSALILATNVTAALGATVAATPATQGSPGVPSFTKPSSVPYLNVFCNPLAYDCIPHATLAYITNNASNSSIFVQHEFGANFDGPLFDLPAGQLKVAIGADYLSEDYWIYSVTSPVTSQIPVPSTDTLGRWAAAAFGQVNVPIFGGNFTLPLVEKLELEISDRFDHYSDFGGTNNPKYSANWTVTDGVLLRGSYGTNYVAPFFKALSGVQGRVFQPINAPSGSSTSLPACTAVGGTPVPGSAAAVLNPTCSAAGQFPQGIQIQGGVGGLNGILNPAGYSLGPETAKDWSLGFDIAPTTGLAGFLTGLDLDATWYNIHVDNLIATAGGGAGLNDPTQGFAYVTRGDPRFNALLQYAQSNPLAGSNLANLQFTAVQFIQAAVYRNLGSLDHDGIDFKASYDWDAGVFGAWNAGITGTYTLRNVTVNIPGGPPSNMFDINRQSEVQRMAYRARLGWADQSGFSVIAFMDYQAHLFSTASLPPAAYLAEFPNYSDLMPAQYLFDLAFAYNTGDMPSNDYAKRINISFTVNNIMNRTPPFQYGGTQNAYAYFAANTNPYGRYWLLTISKSW